MWFGWWVVVLFCCYVAVVLVAGLGFACFVVGCCLCDVLRFVGYILFGLLLVVICGAGVVGLGLCLIVSCALLGLFVGLWFCWFIVNSVVVLVIWYEVFGSFVFGG